MTPNLYCTICAQPLEIADLEQGEGVTLACSGGHRFFYSPAHLERGDVLVIGEGLAFQCANDGPFAELLARRS